MEEGAERRSEQKIGDVLQKKSLLDMTQSFRTHGCITAVVT